MFNDFIQCVKRLSKQIQLFGLCLTVVKSVLYLNTTNPEYFRKGVEWHKVGPTLTQEVKSKDGIQMNKGLAVIALPLQNTTCDTPTLQNEFDGARHRSILLGL